MKTRYGFVSNSSSSSFILGYGLIKDSNKLNDYFETNNIKISYNVNIKKQYEPFEYQNENELRGGNCTTLNIPEDLYLKGDILIVNILNDEGDEMFYNEFSEEFDYDKAKEISFYNTEQQALINLFNNSDIIKQNNRQVVFGAERNG
jgi:hypothetical protein